MCVLLYLVGLGLHLGHYHNKGLLFTEIPESVDNDVLCYRLKPNLQTYFHGVPLAQINMAFVIEM